MGSDQLIASRRVSCRDDRVDLFEWHFKRPEPPDDLGGGDLFGVVAAVAGAGVDLGRFEQADAVVMAQRLDVQVGRSREVPDGH